MARSSRRRGAKMPGVSTKTIWLAPSMAMPRTGMRVVCTLWVTIDDLGADQRVDQRRLAGVGRADDGDEAAAGLGRVRCRLAHRRASTRLRAPAAPWPRPARPRACWRPRRARACVPLMRTSTVKRGAWSGPLARDLDVVAAGRGPGPAPIPAARTWRRAASAGAASSAAPQCARTNVARLVVARLEDRSRRAAPRRRRPGSSPCRGRRCRPPTRSAPATAPRSSARATSAQVSPRTRRL